MAQLIDSSVFIGAERGNVSLESILASLGADDYALAAVTAGELLTGVYFADTVERRLQRQALIEGILEKVPVVPFDLQIARVYARIGADVRRAGFTAGVHDLQIAATALAGGHTVVTHNVRDFARVPGLQVRSFPR